jgi:hypothetical protein
MALVEFSRPTLKDPPASAFALRLLRRDMGAGSYEEGGQEVFACSVAALVRVV